jgi:serine/threonine protein kinase
MGVVYRAEDTRLGRQVAVKFLSSRLLDDPLALERFQREARAASALSHPHICALYDIGEKDGTPFLVMELLDGGTLKRKIDARPLPMDAVLDFGAQIADALDTAHGNGIIHRDIKPANIFLTDRAQVKVLDFGLAKLGPRRGKILDPGSDTTIDTAARQQTTAGEALGTLSCMSPEQARGEDLDPRTDLFSFGVVLYEMATGREPFPGRTSAVVFNAILNQTPPAPSSLNPQVPAALDQIILKALEKDRSMRYQSAAEIRADLRRLKRETESGRTVTQPVTAAHSPAATRRIPTGALAAAALAVVLLAGGAAWMLGGDGPVIESVAVLPFTADADPGDIAYLTDGLTETLINGLAQLPGLKVSARSVVFRFRGQNVDPVQADRNWA